MNKDGVTDAMLEAAFHAHRRNIGSMPPEVPFPKMRTDLRNFYSEIYLAMLRASPPVSTDGLVDRMVDIANRDDTTGLATDALREGSEALADRDATIERMREALEPFALLGRSEAAEQFTDGTPWILVNGERRFGGISMGDLRRAAAALDASATGMEGEQ